MTRPTNKSDLVLRRVGSVYLTKQNTLLSTEASGVTRVMESRPSLWEAFTISKHHPRDVNFQFPARPPAMEVLCCSTTFQFDVLQSDHLLSTLYPGLTYRVCGPRAEKLRP
jgi:hypothetical protein